MSASTRRQFASVRGAVCIAGVAFGSAHADSGKDCAAAPDLFSQELAKVSTSCRHPLCGRIFVTQTNTQAAELKCPQDGWQHVKSAIDSALAAKGVVILGETHDSAIHHRLQAALVRQFAATATLRPAVVMEQLRDDQQPGLDRFADFAKRTARLPNSSELKRYIDWDKSGWPKDIYDPLFEVVIAAKLPLAPGDVPREAIMKTAKEGEIALAPDLRKRLALDKPLGSKLDAASLDEIGDAHCGALPTSALAGMAFAQRYRDAHLADATLKAAEANGGAFLITGTTHARTDRGVPWYTRTRAPTRPTLSLMFVEVDDAHKDPQDFMPLDPDGRPATDILVFTPATDHGDPCAKMRTK